MPLSHSRFSALAVGSLLVFTPLRSHRFPVTILVLCIAYFSVNFTIIDRKVLEKKRLRTLLTFDICTLSSNIN